MKKLAIVLFILVNTCLVYSQNPGNEMFHLSQMKDNIKSKQVSSADKTGGNGDCLSGIKDGAKVTIFDVKGAGIITRIWITIAPEADKASRNDIIIRMYWDGSAFPSVESPIGSFFGNGWDETLQFCKYTSFGCARFR
jgi:hypothetical protein